MKSNGRTTQRQADAAGSFLFTLDEGDGSPAWVKSVAGGGAKAELISQLIDGDAPALKQLDSSDVEPITIELAMGAGSPILDWLQSSWRGAYSRRTGAIVHTSDKGEIVYEQHFRDALIVETTIPALDASEHAPAYLTMKIQPEETWITREGKGHSVGGEEYGDDMGAWSSSNFRIELFGRGGSLDCADVCRIESFTVKQRVARLATGTGSFVELEHTSIKFPGLTIYTRLASAHNFLHWHDEFVLQNRHGSDDVLRGYIEILDQSGRKALFYIDLDGVSIRGVSIERRESKAATIRLCKVELSVESMGLRAWDVLAGASTSRNT